MLAVSRCPWQPVAIAMDPSSLGDGADDEDWGRPTEGRRGAGFVYITVQTLLTTCELRQSDTESPLRLHPSAGAGGRLKGL